MANALFGIQFAYSTPVPFFPKANTGDESMSDHIQSTLAANIWKRIAPVSLVVFMTLCSPAYAQTCTLIEQSKVIPFDTQTLDRFGRAVSISGSNAIIGAYHDADNGIDAGTVFLYHFNGTSWIRARKLVPTDVGPGDRFGTSVSIDGDRAIVGCVYDTDLGSRSGSAYIFKFNGTSWLFEAKIHAADGAIDDRFGRSVSIHGNVAVVGAIWDDDKGIDSGSAYVFRFNGTTWNQETKLTASDGMTLDKFGWDVSLSNDVLIVGAKWNDTIAADSGASYIFRYDGTAWNEEAKLAPPTGMADDHFGYSVAIEDNIAVAGATWDGDLGLKAGAAYIYRFDGTNWNQEIKLHASDGLANDRFGYSVSISGDKVVVGDFAHPDNGIDAGSAFLYMHDGTTWVEQGELLPADGTTGDHYGRSVAISGNTIIAGAYFDDQIGLEAGSAYFFDVVCATPCPADLNNDGTLNFFDVSAFLGAFAAQSPEADFTGDGVFNFFDVSAFLGAFSAGCP